MKVETEKSVLISMLIEISREGKFLAILMINYHELVPACQLNYSI